MGPLYHRTPGPGHLRATGYNATGLDAVLKGAGVPKGAFYHYFSSKEDFGLALIDQDERFRQRLSEVFWS